MTIYIYNAILLTGTLKSIVQVYMVDIRLVAEMSKLELELEIPCVTNSVMFVLLIIVYATAKERQHFHDKL